MKYELNNLLKACKQKKKLKKDKARTCTYKDRRKKTRRGCTHDNLHKRKCTGCQFIYTIKKRTKGKNIHVQEIIPINQ